MAKSIHCSSHSAWTLVSVVLLLTSICLTADIAHSACLSPVWHEWNGSCYLLLNSSYTHQDAARVCGHDHHAQLATVSDGYSAIFVMRSSIISQ